MGYERDQLFCGGAWSLRRDYGTIRETVTMIMFSTIYFGREQRIWLV